MDKSDDIHSLQNLSIKIDARAYYQVAGNRDGKYTTTVQEHWP
jgi:hypothetical protein